jgi:hypothetical protein
LRLRKLQGVEEVMGRETLVESVVDKVFYHYFPLGFLDFLLLLDQELFRT